MAESKVKRENFIALQGWQVADLGLKGNELIIYACIYGFSQDDQTFSGSLQYLADWTNSTKQSVIKCLKSLQEKGYIEKKENYVNGVKFCEYYTTKLNTLYNKVEYPIKQSLTGGAQQSLTNNIGLGNIPNKKDDNKTPFDPIIEEYAKGNKEITDLLKDWLNVRKAKRSAMTDRAIQMNIDKLDKLAAKSNMSVKEYLQEVICRGWAAFYEIQNYTKPATVKRTEPTPKWMAKEQQKYNFDEIERTMSANLGNSQELRERADALKQRLAQ